MKKIFKIIGSFPFGLILFILSTAFLAFDTSRYFSYGDTLSTINYSVQMINDVSVSGDYTCVLDNYQNLLFIKDGKVLSLLRSKDFGYKFDFCNFYSSVFDDDNNLYVYYSVYNEDSYTAKYDIITKINPEGKIEKDIVCFSYENEDSYIFKRSENLFGLSYHDGYISFLKKENVLDFSEYSYNVSNGLFTKGETYSLENYPFVDAAYADDKGYALLLANADIGYFKDGNFEKVYETDFKDAFDTEDFTSFLPIDIEFIDSKLYALSGVSSLDVALIEDGEALNRVDFIDFADENELDIINCLLFDNNGKTGVVLGQSYVKDMDTWEISDSSYWAGMGYCIRSIKDDIGIPIAFLMLLISAVLMFGAFVKWKLSILTKQLLATLPFMLVAFTILAIFLFGELANRYDQDMDLNMASMAQIGARAFDGDELEKYHNYDYVTSGKAYEDYLLLNDIIKSNKAYWSKNIDASLIRYYYDDVYGSSFYTLSSSNEFIQPFTSISSLDDHLDVLHDKNTGFIVMVAEGEFKNFYICDASIFNSKGELVGVFEISTDNDAFINQFFLIAIRVVAVVFFLMIVLVSIISVSTYFNVKNLHKASSVVADIAKGDFSKRVKKTGKDEVGEICKGVNEMADRLDNLFKEKDENEQFYYKFVPEQFKDLLHKEKFTELNLGDAESVDLTVLFCDIRSFSIRSETMTAKENFEFINIIFGIAGPIIRKYNGFVDKYIGDAIMALFENAEDAVKCGEELYKYVVLDDETAKKLNVSYINIGIGIHTGMARIGIIGEEERMSGTVISNTVNLSSRLESLTKQYDTAMIITKDTLDRLNDPDSVNTRYLGMIQVAGVNDVNALYEVLDCLDEKRFEERNKSKNAFREAVRLFHLGDLKGSLELFKSIDVNEELDPVVGKYIRYIDYMINTGSKDSNVFRFSRK